MPPYVIFHDATLREMALQRPRDRLAFGELPGVGEKKLAKYADDFIEVISAFDAAIHAPEVQDA